MTYVLTAYFASFVTLIGVGWWLRVIREEQLRMEKKK
jgi:hypothetical protein